MGSTPHSGTRVTFCASVRVLVCMWERGGSRSPSVSNLVPVRERPSTNQVHISERGSNRLNNPHPLTHTCTHAHTQTPNIHSQNTLAVIFYMHKQRKVHAPSPRHLSILIEEQNTAGLKGCFIFPPANTYKSTMRARAPHRPESLCACPPRSSCHLCALSQDIGLTMLCEQLWHISTQKIQ